MKTKRWLYILGGFLGWFVLNTLMYTLLNLSDSADRQLNTNMAPIWSGIILANLAALLMFATFSKTRWLALGMAGALVINLGVTALLFSSQESLRFIPLTYPVYPQKTETLANHLPIGRYEGRQGRVNPANCLASGWAADPDDPERDLVVRVLANDIPVAQTVAGAYRPELESAAECPGGTCAFEVELWDSITPGQAQTIRIQAQDLQTGEWRDLSNSPLKLVCIQPELHVEATQEPAVPAIIPQPGDNGPLLPFSVSGNRIKFRSEQGYLIVEFLNDELVHFELSAVGSGAPLDQPIYTSPMIYKTDYPGPSSLSIDQNGVLETPDIRLQVDPDTLCFIAIDKDKEPDLALTEVCPYHLDQSWKGITLTPESFTHAYGLGQEFITPGSSDGDWIGRVRSPGGEMGNAMNGWNGGWVGNTQLPIVYFAGEGEDSYALFLDNYYKQNWDFTASPWRAEMWGNWLRFYLLTGSNLPDLRQDYMALTGHPPVPPKKMFGLWISEYGFDNWSEIDDKLRTLRARGFPVDGFVLDLQWFGGIKSGSDDSRMGSLTWDSVHFPSPEEKIAWYREAEGISLIAIEESYISQNLPEHADLESRGYLARECKACGAIYLDTNSWWGKGGMQDWSNPAASEFWHDTKREPLLAAGLIGHWTDLGEPEAYDSRAWYWGIGGDYLPLNEHRDVHNLYNFFWSQSIFEGYMRNDRQSRPFILSRSGAAGSQRFGVSMWSGDIGSNLSSLATHMNAQMHMSLSGIDYYGADIGGFHRSALDGNLKEMYTQWFANGMAFDLPARTHTENLCNCKETAPDRVGDLGSNLANLRLRYELSPYLYSLSHRAYLFAEPLFPPLVYYYQDDPQVREMGHEKLIGRDLLVAVVASNAETGREVYLPAGDWINYHTLEWFHSSGEWFGLFQEYDHGLFQLPMFARAGAIIPQMYVDDQTMNILGKRIDGSLRDELILSVYPGADPSSFTLYEDDGETIAYQHGELRTTLISQLQSEAQVTVSISKAAGTYNGAPMDRDNLVRLVIENADAITHVRLNGEALPQYTSRAEFEAAPQGWYYAGDHLVLAKSGRLGIYDLKSFEFQLGD